MSNNKNLVVEVITACFVVAAIGGLLLLNRNYQSTIDTKDAEIAGLRSAQQTAVADEPKGSDVPTQVNQVAVAFTPGGLFEEAEKAEITTKLIEPYLDYAKEIGSPNDLASIHVQHPVEGEAFTEYTVDVIYQNDGYAGFIYGDSSLEIQPWWQPQCFEACEFSEAFRQKYPEIVEQGNEKD